MCLLGLMNAVHWPNFCRFEGYFVVLRWKPHICFDLFKTIIIRWFSWLTSELNSQCSKKCHFLQRISNEHSKNVKKRGGFLRNFKLFVTITTLVDYDFLDEFHITPISHSWNAWVEYFIKFNACMFYIT